MPPCHPHSRRGAEGTSCPSTAPHLSPCGGSGDVPVAGKLQKGVKHTQVFLTFRCSCPGTEVKGTSRPKLQGMRQKGGEGVPGQHPHQQLCLPAQQDPKGRGEGHDILWPSRAGGQSSLVAALVPGHVTWAPPRPAPKRHGAAEPSQLCQAQGSTLGSSSTSSFLGLPSPGRKRREAPTSTALGRQ